MARAKRVHIPLSQVIKANKGGYFIAPRGVKGKAKHAYAEMRSHGYSKAKAARIAHSLNKKRGSSRG